MIFVSVVSPTVCEDGRTFCINVLENKANDDCESIRVGEYGIIGNE